MCFPLGDFWDGDAGDSNEDSRGRPTVGRNREFFYVFGTCTSSTESKPGWLLLWYISIE
jgi:hypothetical protein